MKWIKQRRNNKEVFPSEPHFPAANESFIFNLATEFHTGLQVAIFLSCFLMELSECISIG